MSPSAVPSESYEVLCPRCKVSFPPERRRCLHCGGATVRPGEAAPHAGGEAALDRPSPFSLQRPPPPGAEASDEDAEEGAGRTGAAAWISRALGLVWIGVFVAITAYRACTGQSPS